MSNPIVVATDFSARADRAVDRAVMLGEQWDCPVKVIHALDAKEAEIFDQAALDRRMRAVLPEGMAGIERVSFAYPEGSAPQALAQAAVSSDAKLVLMGPARHNSLRDFLLGTAVDYALRHCEQPVLIVKNRPHKPYRRLVVATDFSASSAMALKSALAMFPDAEFHLAHGCHVPFESWQTADYVREEVIQGCRQRMDEFVKSLAEEGVPVGRIATTVEFGSAHSAVASAAEANNADLVVIGSHGESGFRHATIGSVANELLSVTDADTLMIVTRD